MTIPWNAWLSLSHPLFTLIAALVLAVSMAAMEKQSARERAWAAARVFVTSLAAVIGGGWLMRLIHG